MKRCSALQLLLKKEEHPCYSLWINCSTMEWEQESIWEHFTHTGTILYTVLFHRSNQQTFFWFWSIRNIGLSRYDRCKICQKCAQREKFSVDCTGTSGCLWSFTTQTDTTGISKGIDLPEELKQQLATIRNSSVSSQ